MKQVITGPYGAVAYHVTRQSAAPFPALDIPDCSFASGVDMVAANSPRAPGVVHLPRLERTRAAVALLGIPAKRGEH